MQDSHHENQLVAEEAASNPLLAFLDRMERKPDVIARRRRSYELLRAERGSSVADIGCGAGTAIFELAELVSPGGSVFGVDINESLINVARARAARRGIHATMQVGDAESLPYADGSLHGYRAERLYQHLRQPEPALKEAHRVLAPGGRIVLVDQDWDSVLLDSNDLATTRSIARATAGGIANGAVGRQYHRLLKDAGFSNVHVVADTHVCTSYDEYGFFPELWAQLAEAMGLLTLEAANAWLSDQKTRGANGRFFLAMTHFLAVGHR
ncbi:MAG: methyltransferase domain-containing protein [Polyangiaceae bacterium]|nr:methyltransferase domain-containing protein [Polyangiaceae bacterium]